MIVMNKSDKGVMSMLAFSDWLYTSRSKYKWNYRDDRTFRENVRSIPNQLEQDFKQYVKYNEMLVDSYILQSSLSSLYGRYVDDYDLMLTEVYGICEPKTERVKHNMFIALVDYILNFIENQAEKPDLNSFMKYRQRWVPEIKQPEKYEKLLKIVERG